MREPVARQSISKESPALTVSQQHLASSNRSVDHLAARVEAQIYDTNLTLRDLVYESWNLGWKARGVLDLFAVHSYMKASQRRKLRPIGLECGFAWMDVRCSSACGKQSEGFTLTRPEAE